MSEKGRSRRKACKAGDARKLNTAKQAEGHAVSRKNSQFSRHLHLPRLRRRYRILLYLCMFIFSGLSLVQVALECFSFTQGIVIYVLAACSLFAGCAYLVRDLRYEVREVIKPGIAANPYTSRVAGDYRLRTFVFAVPGLTGNVIYAVFNGVVGILSHSAWFGSLAAYYILLSMMRCGAVMQERKLSKILDSGERMKKEIKVYQKDSILFVLMAVVLGGMVVLLELSMGGKEYPGFTIYAAAAYTFYKIIKATIDVVKVRHRNSPLLMVVRKIGYIDACVSILILQTAMFASFAEGQDEFIRIMNGATGAGVCLIVLGLGIWGIWNSRRLKREWGSGGTLDD